MTDHGDTPHRFTKRMTTKLVWQELAMTGDTDAVKRAVTAEMLPLAVEALKDGLKARNRWGQPSKSFTRLFFEVAGLVGIKGEVAQQVMALVGASVDVARKAVQAASRVDGLEGNPDEIAARMMDWLGEHYNKRGKRLIVIDEERHASASRESAAQVVEEPGDDPR